MDREGRHLVHNAAIAALAGMMVSGDVSLAGTPPRQAPPKPTGPTDADLARKAAAEAKRERKRQRRLSVRTR